MTIEHESDDLLEELSKGEDEFDVDLMACGCRLAAVTDFDWSIYDFVRLYDLDREQLVSLVGALVDAGGIDHQQLHDLADKVSRGEHQEVDERAQVRVVEDKSKPKGKGKG
jgi:hypothetical protein